jgi:amino acid transporter
MTHRTGQGTVRVLLIGAGVGIAVYGGWLLRPDFAAAVRLLLAGPILHDAVVAPVVGLAGLALTRLLPTRTAATRVWRWWIAAGLAVTGTLLLIALPLTLRPHPAAANPGLEDRDYTTGLAVWLAVFWAVLLLGAFITSRRQTAHRHTPVDHESASHCRNLE